MMDRSVASAIVLDMDGVLFRTNDAKYRAMLGLFERYPTKTTAISEFILRSGGVPRAEKLKYILESIVGIVPSEPALDEYLAKITDPRLRRLLRVPDGSTTLVALRGVASYDRRDNPFVPTTGYYFSVSSELASTLQ